MKRILFVDDESSMLDGLKRMLRPMRSQWNMVFLDSAEQAWELLQHDTVDAVVSDLCMPGMDGLRLLRTIRDQERYASVAIVMLTGAGSESAAVAAMKSGAQDYLVKGSVTRDQLQTAIEEALTTLADQRERVERAEQVEQFSRKLAEANSVLSLASRLDSLTKLLSRGAWEETVVLEQARSERHDHPYGIVMIDIDHFKRFNDSAGHQAGDECLRQVARCIDRATRTTDVVGRYGGEEFIILAPETDLDGSRVLGERVRCAVWELNTPHPASQTGERVTVSVGVAARSRTPWKSVVKEADEALYAAKDGGRNQVRVATVAHDTETSVRVTVEH